MNNFHIFAKLAAIMFLVSILAIGITTYFLYVDEIDKQGNRLEETARRVKKIIISIVDYHIVCVNEGHHAPPNKDPDHVKDASITQLKGALTHSADIDDIEITVGYLRNGQIWWISQSFQEERLYVPIRMGHLWAVPMQRALEQKAGRIRDKDYGGQDVLAAYDYVKSIEIGIVAKTFIKTIQDRFIKGALFAAIPAALIVCMGVAIFILVSKPVVTRLEHDNKVLREMELELLETEHRLTCFYEGAFEGIAITRSGKFLDGNNRFLDMFGYTREEMIGMSICDFVADEDQKMVFDNIKKKYNQPYQHRALHKNGSIRHVEVCGQHTQYHGKPVRVTAIHDITDKKIADAQISKLNDHHKQVSKMEAIGNFASGIAHDFNNAMQPVIGHCDVLLYEMAKEVPERRHILEILAAAETATRLVHRIQSFTRKGHGVEQLQTLRLGGCLKETFEFLRSMIPKSIKMELDVADDLELITATDITIRQILMNLCKNAAQAMPSNTGKITIRALNDSVFIERYGIRPGKYIRIEVEDNGKGMSREILDKALDPYFTTKRIDEGTGIGLSVVNGIISGYNGFVRLYSEPEKGTTVLIYIPVVKDTGQVISECKLTDEVKMGNGESILLVDDEEAIIDAISKTLESLNYKVTSFKSSLKAFKEFAKNPQKYDILVTDLTMPEMTGLTLIKEIKNIKPEIKIVLCSGLGSNGEHAKDTFGNSVGVYMTKPVTRRGYGEILAQILGKEDA